MAQKPNLVKGEWNKNTLQTDRTKPAPQFVYFNLPRRDSTDGRAVALYPADPGSNPVISMLQRALWLYVSPDRPN